MQQYFRKLSVVTIASLLIIICCINPTVLASAEVGPNVNISHTSRSNGGESEFITELWSDVIDENNDNTSDYLVLGIKLNITISDYYSIYTRLEPSDFDDRASLSETFEPGEYERELKFDGKKIYDSGRNGPYTIEILLYQGSKTVIEKTYQTGPYTFESFNPTPTLELSGMESIKVVSNTIQLETETFVAVIYELSPMIEFYYTSDDGQTTRFKITYENVIGFNDNGDGRFQKNELRYWGDLRNSHWSSPKTLMENFNNFDFEVQSIVDLLDANGGALTTKISIVFHYSSLTEVEDLAAARKFDITLKILGEPLNDITHFTLEHTLTDEMSNHDFKVEENKISFVTSDNEEHGYYTWKDYIEVTTRIGDNANKEVTYNLESTADPAMKKLYLNYPYSMDTSELFHDPVVGVNPENAPKLPTTPEPETISHGQWIIIYILVAIIAAAVMIGNIYHQKKKRKY